MLITLCFKSLYKSSYSFKIETQSLLFNEISLRYINSLIVREKRSIIPNLLDPLYICSYSATTVLSSISLSLQIFLNSYAANSLSAFIILQLLSTSFKNYLNLDTISTILLFFNIYKYPLRLRILIRFNTNYLFLYLGITNTSIW